MLKIELRGTELRIQFSFLLFNAVVFLIRDSSVIMQFYAVCAVHELGHLIALAALGVRVRAVDFGGMGIRIITERKIAAPVMSDLIVLLSGPAANLAVCALLRAAGCSGDILALNIAAAVYNLLPFRQLDGGAAIELFVMGSVHERAAERVLFAVRAAIIAVGIILRAIAKYPL